MITHVLKNCSKTSLICWVKPSTTPNEAIEKNVFQISKNVLLWISLKSVPSGLSPRDHDIMESAIENFEEVIRTRPHKPRSMWCVCCQQSTCPNAIQYQAKDNQQFVRAISINKYLTKKEECFLHDVFWICHWYFKFHWFLLIPSVSDSVESSASTALAAAIALAAKSAASLWALKHIMRGETVKPYISR